LSAAINLSQNGYNVDIFERNLDVGNNISKGIERDLKTGQRIKT
jgi:phytoene dehydrogenase-like protein